MDNHGDVAIENSFCVDDPRQHHQKVKVNGQWNSVPQSLKAAEGSKTECTATATQGFIPRASTASNGGRMGSGAARRFQTATRSWNERGSRLSNLKAREWEYRLPRCGVWMLVLLSPPGCRQCHFHWVLTTQLRQV
jgi:hypothetical protein